MDIAIQVTDDGREFLIKEDYDGKYEARPLWRTIQSQMENRLAEKTLDGEIHSGDEIEITKTDEGLHFEVRTLSKK